MQALTRVSNAAARERVIAAEAHAPQADAVGIEIAARLDVISDRLDRHFVVAADREIVFAFALAGAVEGKRRNAARQERPLVGVHLLLRGIQAGAHDHHGGPQNAGGLAQDAVEHRAIVGDLHALAGRIEMRQRQVAAFHRLHVRGFHLRHVVDEHELGEVVVNAGALADARRR